MGSIHEAEVWEPPASGIPGAQYPTPSEQQVECSNSAPSNQAALNP